MGNTETQSKVMRKEYLLKRPFDCFLALFGLVLSSPLWLIISIAIALDDGGSILFSQGRCGRNGREFNMLKFRTMKSSGNKTHQIIDYVNDPRVTRVGALLRNTAMDELPVLINILKGEMSFVGPKPIPFYIEDEDKLKYGDITQVPGYELRSQLRPGLTGYAQVYALKDIDHAEKFKYDNMYIDKMSFFFDLKLIILSFRITFKGKWEHRGNKI
jgi:lipopolysaccharide/colanic/teichoic acid biosynthesis glycosyltransferase